MSDWTGVPVGRMVRNEIAQILKLAEHLEERVVGQRYALDQIARRIQTSRAKLDNPAFTDKAPDAVVEKIRERLVSAEHDLARIVSALEALGG